MASENYINIHKQLMIKLGLKIMFDTKPSVIFLSTAPRVTELFKRGLCYNEDDDDVDGSANGIANDSVDNDDNYDVIMMKMKMMVLLIMTMTMACPLQKRISKSSL